MIKLRYSKELKFSALFSKNMNTRLFKVQDLLHKEVAFLLLKEIQKEIGWKLLVNENYIIEKYGSISSAQTTNKYYYQIVRPEVARTGTSERIPEVKIIVDSTTYDTLDSSVRSEQTIYDWEVEINDEKRVINLINPDFIQDIEYEIKQILSS